MPTFDLRDLKQIEGLGTIIHQTEMASTSDVAKEILLVSFMEVAFPMLVLCDRQTLGRGQPGKSWLSNEQSLTFTWCIPVESVPQANRALLPLIAGVSVCEAIGSMGIKRARLKWPNDILIDRKKVCGILVEKISTAEQSWFLIGVGINVNQTEKEIDALGSSDFAFPPGSLKTHFHSDIELQTLLLSLTQQLAENTTKETQWNERCENHFDFLGAPIRFTKPEGVEVVGTFKGVDTNGRIRIEVEGQIQSFTSGQLYQL